MFAIVMLLVFFAALCEGVIGFGFALILVPALLLFMSPAEVVPLVVCLGIATSIYMVIHVRKNIDFKYIWPLMLPSFVGVPLGVYVLHAVDVQALKVAIGVLTILFAIQLKLKFHINVTNQLLKPLVGFLSGFLKGSIALPGPPIALFLSNEKIPKKKFRASIVTFFAVIAVPSLVGFVYSDLLTLDTVQDTVFLLPSLFLGILTGTWLSEKINEHHFRDIVLYVVMLSGAVAIGSVMY